MKKGSIIYGAIALSVPVVLLVLWMTRKPNPLETALKLAGSNRTELEKVLEHYSKTEADSLKLKAAEFLIANMPGLYGIEQELKDRFGNKVAFDFSAFKAGEHIRLSYTMDSLGYRFVQTRAKNDLDTIQAQYLIENIDLAFEVWQYPWCKHINFDQFCEYVLPYRCQSESLSNYRRYFNDKYSWLIDSLKNPEDALETAAVLQRSLKKEIRYSTKYSGFYQGFLSPVLMGKVRVGACDKLGNYCVLAMRSCGIPITYDQILYWSGENSGHVYNSIIAANDNEYFFSLPDGPPEKRKLGNGTTKVWRTTCQLQNRGIWDEEIEEDFPSMFLNHHFVDITARYSMVSDLNWKIRDTGDSKIIYLCTFNWGGWRSIAWSKIEPDGSIYIKDVTKDLLYSFAVFRNGELVPVDYPFRFDSKAEIVEKIPTPGKFETLKFMRNPGDTEISFETNSSGKHFTIYYFNKQWIPITTTGIPYILDQNKKWKKVENETNEKSPIYYQLKFEKVPVNAIFKKSESGKIFDVQNNRPSY